MERKDFAIFASEVGKSFGASYCTAQKAEEFENESPKVVLISLFDEAAKEELSNPDNFDREVGWLDFGHLLTSFIVLVGEDKNCVNLSFDKYGEWNSIDWSKVVVQTD